MSIIENNIFSLYGMYIIFKEIPREEFDEAYTGIFLNNLILLIDKTKNNEEYYRKSVYLFFKSLVTPCCSEFLRMHTFYNDVCKDKAEEVLQMIEIIDVDSKKNWENTRKAVLHFLKR